MSENKAVSKLIKLSPEQEIAADPSKNVWVRANAGTGKTAVLTRRLVKLILSGAEFSSILCLTYTEAGTSEMRNRISAELSRFARMNDAEITADYFEIFGREPSAEELKFTKNIFYYYLDNMENLKIQTIHGFCQDILRRFPIEAGVDPAWSVIQETDMNRLIDDTMEQVWKKRNDTELGDAILRLANSLSEGGFDNLKEIAKAFYKDFFDFEFNINNTSQFIERIQNFLEIRIVKIDGLHDKFLDENRKIYGVALPEMVKGERFKNLGLAQAMIDYVDGKISDLDYAKKLLTASDGKPWSPSYYGISEKKVGGDILSFITDEQNRFLEVYQNDLNQNLLLDTAALHIFLSEFMRILRASKEKIGALNFEDMILCVIRLFQKPDMMGWILYQLDSRIHHIMVDEAQDTSPEQWEIIRGLLNDFWNGAKRASLFVVGDPKQSIYSFQGADLNNFMNVHQMIRRLIGENMYELSDIDFKKSFRTLPVILGLVDSFFKQDSIFQLSNLNQDIEHISGRADGAVGRIEIMPIVSAKDEKFKSDSTDDGTEQKATEQAKEFFINQIADKIQTILKMRDDVKPDDIMILVKKRNPFAAPMIDALQKRNIPVSGADRISLPDYPPVMDLLAMMRFCIDNTDDYSLACALKSPFFELSDDEIFKLCRGNTRLDENNKLRGTIFEEIKITRPELFNKLQNIISHAINLAPYSFMMWLLDENRIGNFSVRENMLRRMGTQINDPLEEFLTLSLAFERTQSGGIIEFIDWFIKGESVVKRDMNIADGVKVMTVYGAKGLEAKIVFLIDTASLKDNSERSHPLRLPNGLWVWKAADMRKVAALARFYEQQEIQKINEYYRLCYVAMTRPKNELYIYGYTQYNDAAKESWYTNLRAVFGGADDNSNTIVIE